MELAHERRGDIGIDLTVQKDRAVRICQQIGHRLQIIERADGRGLEAEGFGDRREVDIGKNTMFNKNGINKKSKKKVLRFT